ncbi:hypothetical protein A0H76_2286 [Hepatospora eriocheir]|uniref:Brix domain-containing protein n=1 Tax=Hepatospora eriocheir TaxID=1081669 RepID=A0A1X0QFM5_9MICR|nr:hypothetical protein A0H76_2286 [Hepatospora eriocheir]
MRRRFFKKNNNNNNNNDDKNNVINNNNDQEILYERKLILTTNKPSKKLKIICKHLRMLLRPHSLYKMKEFNIPIKDVIKDSEELSVAHIIYCMENKLIIGDRKEKVSYYFDLVEYENNFKMFKDFYYKDSPFVKIYYNRNDMTDDQIEIDKELSKVFEKFGTVESKLKDFKRLLQIFFENGLIYIRHYCYSIEDVESNFKVSLREIGPRFTLKFIKKEENLLKEFVKKNK